MKERRMQEIVLKAMGQAINKTVAITEIIKVSAILNVLSVNFESPFGRKNDVTKSTSH